MHWAISKPFQFCCIVVGLLCGPSLYAIGLKNPKIIPTNALSSLAAADVNGDGKVDLIIIEQGQPPLLRVLLGDGQGGFSQGGIRSLPAFVCCAVTVANFSSDTYPDLIIVSSGTSEGAVAVLTGNGNGTFNTPKMSPPLPGGNFPGFGYPAIGDVNEDSHPDIVVSDVMNNRLYVFPGDGTGAMTVIGPTGGGGRREQLRDINGDGHLDRLTIQPFGGASYSLGSGTGTFANAVSISAPGTSFFADFDRDGHMDLVVGQHPGSIAWFRGHANGTFDPITKVCDTATPPGIFAITDFDGDNISDVAWGTPGGITVLRMMPGLACGATKTSLAPSADAGLTAVADFNGDGVSDVAAWFPGGIAILVGNGDGTFFSADSYDMGQTVSWTTVADFNRDGRPDIAVGISPTTVRLLLNQGSDIFALGPAPPTGSGGSRWSAGDFDGDGKPDLVSAAYPYAPKVLFGNGDGTFAPPVEMTEGSTIVADVNKDGRADMVTIAGNGASAIAALLGRSDRGFDRVTTPLRNPTFAAVVGFSDLNGDNKLDVIQTAYQSFDVWMGNGNGSFTYNRTVAIPPQVGTLAPDSTVLADLDQDARPDVVFTVASPPSLVVLYGNGDGGFQAPVTTPLSSPFTSVTAADMDQDGKMDLVVYRESGLAVLPGLGGRQFDQEMTYLVGSGLYKVETADLNGDGFPDLAAANGQGRTVSVLLSGNYPSPISPSTTLVTSPNPSAYGQPFTVTYAATPRNGQGTIPTGVVGLRLNGAFLSTEQLDAQGHASFLINATLFPGVYSVGVTYYGDSTYRPSASLIQHKVNVPLIPTQTVLSVTPTSVYASQTLRLVATVTKNGERWNGMVTFYDGEQTLKAVRVDQSGIAIANVATLQAGTHQLKAVYNGYTLYTDVYRETYLPSTSAVVPVTVAAYPVEVDLTTSTPTAVEGAVVTLHAGVTSTTSPFGAVTFYDGLTPLKTLPLRGDGTATFSTAVWGRGPHSLSARFSANGIFAAGTSPAVNLSIYRASAKLTATRTALSRSSADAESVIAAVSSGRDGSPVTGGVGNVTFIDAGQVVGVVPLDASGYASVRLPEASASAEIQASYSGDAAFATSASPVLRRERVANQPSFALHSQGGVGRLSVREPLAIFIAGDAGFNRRARFHCEGLPAGYDCVFTPGEIVGSGTSTLRVVPTQAAGMLPGLLSLLPIACLLLLITISRQRCALLLTACAIGVAGCGGEVKRVTPTVTVVTVSATSDSESPVTMDSMQIVVVTDR